MARHQEDAERLVATGAAYRDFTDQGETVERDREVAGASFRFDRALAQLSPEAEGEKMAQGIPYAIRFRCRIWHGVELPRGARTHRI